MIHGVEIWELRLSCERQSWNNIYISQLPGWGEPWYDLHSLPSYNDQIASFPIAVVPRVPANCLPSSKMRRPIKASSASCTELTSRHQSLMQHCWLYATPQDLTTGVWGKIPPELVHAVVTSRSRQLRSTALSSIWWLTPKRAYINLPNQL